MFEYETQFNRVTKITDALNQATRFTHDPVTGNLLATTDPLAHATAIAYNHFGQPISVTDALNHTTTFEYDEVGNLIATTDPLGNRPLRFYDAVSRLIALVDPRGKGAQFTNDALRIGATSLLDLPLRSKRLKQEGGTEYSLLHATPFRLRTLARQGLPSTSSRCWSGSHRRLTATHKWHRVSVTTKEHLP